MTQKDTRPIHVALIRIDGGTQPREAINETTVGEYAEAMTEGAEFPPLDLFFDGAEYWLADGFHRYHAANKIGLVEIPAKMHSGTRRDAVLFSVGVNQGHGLRRTNADKRKAVMTLMTDIEWSQWSNVEIGRRCGVSHELANVVRKSLAESASEQPRTYTTKHGTVATMRTENIGRPQIAPEKVQAIRDRIVAGQSVESISAELKTSSGTIANIRKEMGLGGVDKSGDAVTARRARMAQMAADGYTTRQIAATVELSEQACKSYFKSEGIEVPADKVVGSTRRHDANRIIEQIVADAENLTEGVNLIDFDDVDRAQIAGWLRSLHESRDKFNAFIRRLTKEQQHGEAA